MNQNVNSLPYTNLFTANQPLFYSHQNVSEYTSYQHCPSKEELVTQLMSGQHSIFNASNKASMKSISETQHDTDKSSYLSRQASSNQLW